MYVVSACDLGKYFVIAFLNCFYWHYRSVLWRIQNTIGVQSCSRVNTPFFLSWTNKLAHRCFPATEGPRRCNAFNLGFVSWVNCHWFTDLQERCDWIPDGYPLLLMWFYFKSTVCQSSSYPLKLTGPSPDLAIFFSLAPSVWLGERLNIHIGCNHIIPAVSVLTRLLLYK